MKKIFLILFTLNISLLTIESQPSITWQRSYPAPVIPPEDLGNAICKADSNNIFIVGTTNTSLKRAYIIKINPYGDTIWSKLINNLDAFAAVSSGDGGCVFTGNNPTQPGYAYAVKIRTDGSIEWNKTYPPLGYVICWRIIKTTVNGYLACGYRPAYEGYILKIDSIGNYQWDRSYPAGYAKFYRGICEASEGGYLAVGSIIDSQTGPLDGVVSKIDSVGNIIWEKRYMLNNAGINFETILRLPNGYIIGGSCWDPVSAKDRSCFIKINSEGDTLYTKIFEGDIDNINRLEDLKIINTNNYVFTEARFHPNYDVSSKTFITDSLGNVLKMRIFDETTIVGLSRILPLINGDIMFVGAANYVNEVYQNVHVIRTDSNLYAPPIGIVNNKTNTVQDYVLYQNYPNPFNISTNIRLDLKKSGHVKINIYDINGKEIFTIKNSYLQTGQHQFQWNAEQFASGVYFCVLNFDVEIARYIKIILLK